MADITVTVEPIGYEDLALKNGAEPSNETYMRTTSTGVLQSMSKISAMSIPLEDEDDLFGTDYSIRNIEQLILAWLGGSAPMITQGQFIQSTISSGTSADLIGLDLQGNVVTKQPWGFSPSMHPVGTVIPWCPGYYTDGDSTGFVRADFLETALEEPSIIAACNRFFATQDIGWRVCDGGAPNDIRSPIWNALGRYVPRLIDNRFIKGGGLPNPTLSVPNPSTAVENLPDVEEFSNHHHVVDDVTGCRLTIPQMPAHSHTGSLPTRGLDWDGSCQSVTWDTPESSSSYSTNAAGGVDYHYHHGLESQLIRIANCDSRDYPGSNTETRSLPEPRSLSLLYIIRIF